MRIILVSLILMFAQTVFAQNEIPEKGRDLFFNQVQKQAPVQAPEPAQDQVVFEDPAAQAEIYKLKVDNEFYYIAMLCVLSVVSLTITLGFLRSKDHTAKDIVNITGLNLIIFATIILVLVVNTSEQLTAAIGILGAIAGYLFRSVQDNAKETS